MPAKPAVPRSEACQLALALPGAELARRADLLSEFDAAPWLLPARTPALRYAGQHNFDQLLALRAAPAGRHRRAVTLLLFSRSWAVMVQNSVYSLVKFGGVRNHLLVAWAPEDLAACADLNLPCADVSSWLPRLWGGQVLGGGSPAGGVADVSSRAGFAAVSWLKPALALRALRQGVAVMVADADVAYAPKPLWDSYLAFQEQAGADGAFMQELPLNTGHFVLLPTPGALAFAAAWNESAAAALAGTPPLTDQKALEAAARGPHGTALASSFQQCGVLCGCIKAGVERKRRGREGAQAVLRHYMAPHFMYTYRRCTIGDPLWAPRVDPCDWAVLYLHPVCAAGPASKERLLRLQGFWFMDSEQGCAAQRGAASGVPACQPLQWRLPQAEAAFTTCPTYGLGLVHGGEPAALARLRAGAADGEVQELLASCKS